MQHLKHNRHKELSRTDGVSDKIKQKNQKLLENDRNFLHDLNTIVWD